jgi:hypothetical protein
MNCLKTNLYIQEVVYTNFLTLLFYRCANTNSILFIIYNIKFNFNERQLTVSIYNDKKIVKFTKKFNIFYKKTKLLYIFP